MSTSSPPRGEAPGAPGSLSRARFLRLGMAAAGASLAGTLGILPGATRAAGVPTMHTRNIPSSGEALPVIGCGTWRTFDVGGSPQERAPLAEVLRILFEAGGSAIDSSPMYGKSERVTGDVLASIAGHPKAFVATKVWTSGREAGIAQMRESMTLLRDEHIDLMQIHNLLDWRTHMRTLRAWKAEGRIRYLGVTHYTASAFDQLEAVMTTEQLDFVQLNYALDDRAAAERLLPLAADRGIAVIVNQPFGGGGLLRGLSGKPLPAWAGEIGCASWAQLLLKFVLAHPAVTCVIPGTGKPAHMRDNVLAGVGIYPDKALQEKLRRAAGV